MNGTAGSDRSQFLFAELLEVEDNLQVLYGRAIVEGDELHILVSTTGAHPSFDVNSLSDILRRVGEDVGNDSSSDIFIDYMLEMLDYSKDPIRRKLTSS